LNHDVVVESILNTSSIAFSDGFSNTNSNIIGASGNLQAVFQNDFPEPIWLSKLHGSIDLYGFIVANKKEHFYQPTGERIYFKPESYEDKHHAKRIDSTSKEILQDFNFEVFPRFITGLNKKLLIDNDKMYSTLYKSFESELSKPSDLLLIGYSYLDHHVNTVLQNSSAFELVINVNPGPKYRFHNAKSVLNYKFLDELK
jgi:hypothetical protein